MSSKKPQMRIWPIVGRIIWGYQLKRVKWAEDMIRLGVLTKADIRGNRVCAKEKCSISTLIHSGTERSVLNVTDELY